MSATTDISRCQVDVRWIPVCAAKKILGVSRQRVYQLIEEGALTSVKSGGTVLVGRHAVMARQALNRQAGGGQDDHNEGLGDSE